MRHWKPSCSLQTHDVYRCEYVPGSIAEAVERLWQDKELGVAHHQVDIFLFNATGTYVGRLCHFNECPKYKTESRVPKCWEVPFLQQHEDFKFDSAEALRPGRIHVLFERH